MTTYFYRSLDGSEYTRVLPNIAPVYFATALVPDSDLRLYWESLGAQATKSSNNAVTPCHYQYLRGYPLETYQWYATEDSYRMDPTYPAFTTADMPMYGSRETGQLLIPQQVGHISMYPDPELIRDHHSLYSLLPYLDPVRLHNCLDGPKLDLIEEDTNHKFAIAVPKKMLVLFCGRRVISRYLRTLEREDNENWQGGPVAQELRFPRHHLNHIGVRIAISWMYRACQMPKDQVKRMRVPKSLFAALSLSRALNTLALHRDANRVDHYIASVHYKRPLFPNEIIAIWKCLPKDSKYVYRLVLDLRQKLYEFRGGNKEALPDSEKLLQFLEEEPELKARIEDEEYNNSDEFRPFFGTEWCERAAWKTQDAMERFANSPYKATASLWTWDAEVDGPKPQDDGYRCYGRHYGPTVEGSQSQKHIPTRKDRKSKVKPADWPQFERTVVLTALDVQEKALDRVDSGANSAYEGEDKSNGW